MPQDDGTTGGEAAGAGVGGDGAGQVKKKAGEAGGDTAGGAGADQLGGGDSSPGS